MLKLIAILTVAGAIGGLIFGFNPGGTNAPSTGNPGTVHAHGLDYTRLFGTHPNHQLSRTIYYNKSIDKN